MERQIKRPSIVVSIGSHGHAVSGAPGSTPGPKEKDFDLYLKSKKLKKDDFSVVTYLKLNEFYEEIKGEYSLLSKESASVQKTKRMVEADDKWSEILYCVNATSALDNNFQQYLNETEYEYRRFNNNIGFSSNSNMQLQNIINNIWVKHRFCLTNISFGDFRSAATKHIRDKIKKKKYIEELRTMTNAQKADVVIKEMNTKYNLWDGSKAFRGAYWSGGAISSSVIKEIARKTCNTNWNQKDSRTSGLSFHNNRLKNNISFIFHTCPSVTGHHA